jgi:DNA mismatch repair ATPase MutS
MAFSPQVLALGYSVGRVEEMHSAAARGSSGGGSSKLITRQLVRIYTPGTAVEGLLAVRRHSTPPATCTYASMQTLSSAVC